MIINYSLLLCALPISNAIDPTAQVGTFFRSLFGENPQVELDYGTFRGTTSFRGIDNFLGIPFAKAGRLENPRVVGPDDKIDGIQDATKYGKACPQQLLFASPPPSQDTVLLSLLSTIRKAVFSVIPTENQSEDCLSINVQVPHGINSTSKLPVMFWIHGGGFAIGSSASLGAETTSIQGLIYQGARIVQKSVEMGQPIIFVSANHRLNAFGTLASQEITDAGVSNLALKDQRAAMEWIQKYAAAFGADKTKVTLFGESAGSLSIATHMVLNDGDPDGLFSQAIMASGGIMKLKDYHRTQATFDFIAEHSGCGNTVDKIDCLRKVNYSSIYNAVQQVPSILSYISTSSPWFPRPDGKYLLDSPHRLLRSGKVAKIPYIIGDTKDEGTLFSLTPQRNVTTDAHFQQFFKDNYFTDLTPEEIKAFTDLYSENPAEGSPFDTGKSNQLGPQYKRLAAAIGDYAFQMGRRDLLEHTYSTEQKSYTYEIVQSLPILGKFSIFGSLSNLPILGSFHASDVTFNTFGLIPSAISSVTDHIMKTYIAFVNSGDPNTHGDGGIPHWPAWDPKDKSMYQYKETGDSIIKDDYRDTQMRFVNDHADTYVA